MIYAHWNTQWLSFQVHLNDSATNISVLFFVLHLWPGLLKIPRHVLMQMGTGFIGIFKTSNPLKILGFKNKTLI